MISLHMTEKSFYHFPKIALSDFCLARCSVLISTNIPWPLPVFFSTPEANVEQESNTQQPSTEGCPQSVGVHAALGMDAEMVEEHCVVILLLVLKKKPRAALGKGGWKMELRMVLKIILAYIKNIIKLSVLKPINQRVLNIIQPIMNTSQKTLLLFVTFIYLWTNNPAFAQNPNVVTGYYLHPKEKVSRGKSNWGNPGAECCEFKPDGKFFPGKIFLRHRWPRQATGKGCSSFLV